MTATVPAYGPRTSSVLFVAKAPGREECAGDPPRPMIGRAGREQQSYLRRRDLSQWSFRLTNLCREYVEPDAHLTPEQVAFWEPDLLGEIFSLPSLSLIVAIGSDPIRFFLGKEARLEMVHGIPCRPGEFDSSLAYRAPAGCCILPIYQAAAGFHSADTRALIDWDFEQFAILHRLIQSGRGQEIRYRHDEYAGKERYLDVTGRELAYILSSAGHIPVLGIDTEGTISDPFCLQVCFNPPEAYMLRIDQPDLYLAIQALQTLAARGTVFTGHNLGMYDLEMLRRPFKLDLFHANCHDTLFDAYLFCIEPLGLKPNGFRHLGMRMKSHNETVGAIGTEFQIEYLRRVISLTRGWPKPSPQVKLGNDGTLSIKQKPQPIHTRASKILSDIETGRYSDEGEEEGEEEGEVGAEDEGATEGVNIRSRWRMVRRDLPLESRRVEQELGPLPYATMRRLWERDPEAALKYSCDDSRAHRQLYDPFLSRLRQEGKMDLARTYSKNMHVYSQMQENGMPVHRFKLEALSQRMTSEMLEIAHYIARTYNDGEPINPRSAPQVRKLLERYGLRGIKRTKKKKEVSTGKKSIGYLSYIEPEMDEGEKFRRTLVVKLMEWEKRRNTRDSFCRTALELIPENMDECFVRCQLIPWGTKQRRCATKKPNYLAQPKRSIYGKMVRDCYVAPPGYLFLESDLASIEVCTMAHLSNDPDLIGLLNSGVKFHRETATRLFNTSREAVTETQYQVGKTTIFGTFLGQTGVGLMEQLWMSGLTQYGEDECQAFIDGVKHEVYPAIGKYEEKVARELRGTPSHPNLSGSIKDMWGMERRLPGIHSEDKSTVREAVSQGMSLRISGGAQGLIQNAISWLKDEVWRMQQVGVDVRWLLTIHDSLLMLVPEWAAEMVRAVVEEGLTRHCGVELKVQVRAESKMAKTWGAL